MNVKQKNRRWVKYAAAGFAAVLLLITFFSNTLRNWTLPQVRTQRVVAGTITPAISGSGRVESAGQETVNAAGAGALLSMEAVQGELVQKGQTVALVELRDDGTLEALEAQLEQLEDTYERALLQAQLSGGAGSDNQLQQLTDSLAEAKANLALARDYESKRESLDTRLSAAQADLRQAQAAYDAATQEPRAQLEAANLALADAQAAQLNAQNNESYLRSLLGEDPAPEDLAAWQEAKAALDAANAALWDCQNRQYQAQLALTAQERANRPAVDAAQAAVDELEGERLSLEGAYAGTSDRQLWENQVLSAQNALDAYYRQQQSAEISETLEAMELDRQKKAIADCEAAIRERTAALGTQTIQAPVTGYLTEIYLTAGQDFRRDQPLFTILTAADSYTLRFSVSLDQAAQLSPGVQARILNQPLSDSVVMLEQILPDGEDPTNQKSLIFSVRGGSVAVGQELSLSIPLVSTSYSTVVPNQALYQDALGTFVYVVDSSTSPLGSRSAVRRVDVTVLRSDDSYTAVVGELTDRDYVVTLSTAPLTDGQAVRLGN